MEKKTYLAPAIEDVAVETEEMIATSVDTLTFNDDGTGSAELQGGDLEEGIGGLVRTAVLFGD